MMAPLAFKMCGMASLHVRNWPVRLTAIMRFHSSSVVSVVRRKKPMPATLARTCRPPWRRTASPIASTTAAGLVTSHGTAKASPPAARMVAAVSSAPDTFTSAHATRPPSWPKRSAVALPMPDAAPETKMDRPSNRFMGWSETCFTPPGKGALPARRTCRTERSRTCFIP